MQNERDARVAVVTDLLPPYRIPLFNILGAVLGKGFRVFLMAKSAANRPWDAHDERVHFERTVIRGTELTPGKSLGYNRFWNPGIVAALRAFDPDVIVIGGFHHPTSFAALAYGRLTKKKVALWSESTPFDSRPTSALRVRLKRWFVSRCDAFLVPGTAARRYVVSLGADPSLVFTAPNAIHSPSFEMSAGQAGRPSGPRHDRLPPFLALFAGRLSPEKGLPTLIDAIAALQRQGRQIGLVVAGEGEKRCEYIKMAEDRLTDGSMLFTGHLNPSQLLRWYKAAGVLVLPSLSEPWGFVVNEAMSLRLPVICSPRVGAAFDLIIEGETGFICESPSDYATTIGRLLENPAERERIAENAYRLSRRFTPTAAAGGFIALMQALGLNIRGWPFPESDVPAHT